MILLLEMGNWGTPRISDLPEAEIKSLWQTHNWVQIFQIPLQYCPNPVEDIPLN